MTVFRVGMRVRIKWTAAHARQLIGTETQIVGEDFALDSERWVTALPTSHGTFWKCLKCDAGKVFEPILDQRHEACEEDFKRDIDRLLEGVSA